MIFSFQSLLQILILTSLSIFTACDKKKGIAFLYEVKLSDCMNASADLKENYKFEKFSFHKRDQINFCKGYTQFSVTENIDDGVTIATKSSPSTCSIHLGIVQPFKISVLGDANEKSPCHQSESEACKQLKTKADEQIKAFVQAAYGLNLLERIKATEVVEDLKSLNEKCQ